MNVLGKIVKIFLEGDHTMDCNWAYGEEQDETRR